MRRPPHVFDPIAQPSAPGGGRWLSLPLSGTERCLHLVIGRLRLRIVRVVIVASHSENPTGMNTWNRPAPEQSRWRSRLNPSAARDSVPCQFLYLLRRQRPVEDRDLIQPTFPVAVVVAAPAQKELPESGWEVGRGLNINLR